MASAKEETKPVVTKETPAKNDEEEIFTIHKPEFVSKINIIGQIDLATLNQSTRPKKKSKEERKKERLRNEFKDAILSIAANLRAGYAVENAFGKPCRK